MKSSALLLHQLGVQLQTLSLVGGSCCLTMSVSKKKKQLELLVSPINFLQ